MSIPVTREYTTGPGFTTRLAWAQLRSSYRGRGLLPLGVIVVVLVGLGILGIVTRQANVLIFLIGYPLLIVGLVALTLAFTKRQADLLTPVGSPYRATLGEKSLRVLMGSITSEVPYGTYARVDRVGEFVALRFRSTRLSLILPAELFPGEDFDALAAAVANPAAATAGDALAGGLGTGLEHEYITDAGFATRLARMTIIRAFVRGPMIVILVILTALGLLMLLGGLLGLLLAGTGNISFSEVGPMFAAAAFFLGFTALVVGGSILLVRAQLRRIIPVGSVYGIGFGPATLTMRGPVNSAEIPYSSYKKARRRGQFVELIGTRGNGRVTLPAQLFPGTELERLNSLLGADR